MVGEVQKYRQFRNLFSKNNLLFDDGIGNQQPNSKHGDVLRIDITNIKLFLRMNIMDQQEMVKLNLISILMPLC